MSSANAEGDQLIGPEYRRASDVNLVDLAHKIYQRLQVPLAFALVFLALGVEFTPLPKSVAASSLAALGMILLGLLFRLDNRLRGLDQPATFEEFYQVVAEMRAEFLNRAASSQNIELQAIGMSMSDAWNFMSNLLRTVETNHTAARVRFEVAMLDPTWDKIESFNSDWAESVPANAKAIERFISEHQQLIDSRKWKMSLYFYRHTPNWHGLCIDRQILYLSTCSWHGGRLVGANNDYERFERGSGARANRAFELFDTWLDRIKRVDLVQDTGDQVINPKA